MSRGLGDVYKRQVVDLLEKALGRTAPREMLPMQPGDVPATYADVDDLMRDVVRPSAFSSSSTTCGTSVGWLLPML